MKPGTKALGLEVVQADLTLFVEKKSIHEKDQEISSVTALALASATARFC